MDYSKLSENIRKAYRLLYSVQESLVDFVEFVREIIRYKRCAGKQLFSSSLQKTSPYIDDCSDQFGNGMWAWDYFPAYMYIYYFELEEDKDNNACFSIIQVMDDGSFNLGKNDRYSPNPENFLDSKKSHSFLLFAFAKWSNTGRIWFDNNGKESVDRAEEIIRISKETNNNKKYYAPNESKPSFIVRRIEIEEVENEEKTRSIITEYAKLIKDKCDYNILKEKN